MRTPDDRRASSNEASTGLKPVTIAACLGGAAVVWWVLQHVIGLLS